MDKEFLMGLALSEEVADTIMQAHDRQLSALRFENLLTQAVQAAGGRSVRAIGAMLELEQLQAAEEPAVALKQALTQLKTDCGYLFYDSAPPYAREPGTRQGDPIQKPVTLAGAIRQKYERK